MSTLNFTVTLIFKLNYNSFQSQITCFTLTQKFAYAFAFFVYFFACLANAFLWGFTSCQSFVKFNNLFFRIGGHESTNKMPFHNLAVVFGPTLLKPAVKDQATDAMSLFSSGANDAMYQSGILFYYLTLLNKGTQFR